MMRKFINGLLFLSAILVVFAIGWGLGSVATNAWHVQNNDVAIDVPGSIGFGLLVFSILLVMVAKALDIVYEAGIHSTMGAMKND